MKSANDETHTCSMFFIIPNICFLHKAQHIENNSSQIMGLDEVINIYVW